MRLIERPITPASHNQLGGIEKILPREFLKRIIKDVITMLFNSTKITIVPV
jgi:hypothetical protein